MVADDLAELGRRGHRIPFEQPAKRSWRSARGSFGSAQVRGVADEDVREAETILGGTIDARRLDELLSNERDRAALRPTCRRGARARGSAAPELPADHRRRFITSALFRLQAVEACGEQSVNRRRDGEVASGARSPRSSRAAARRRAGFPRRPRGSGSASPSRPRHRRAGARAAPRPRARSGSSAGRARLARASRDRGRADRASQADDEDRRPAAPAHEVFEQVEQRRLGPVDVLENQHERPSARDRLEETAQCPERLLGARLASARPIVPDTRPRHESASGTPSSSSRLPPRASRRRPRPGRFRDGPERDAVAVREARPRHRCRDRRAANSCASRDFPMPAGPTTVTRRHVSSSTVARVGALEDSRSWSRPTNGASSRRRSAEALVTRSSCRRRDRLALPL